MFVVCSFVGVGEMSVRVFVEVVEDVVCFGLYKC